MARTWPQQFDNAQHHAIKKSCPCIHCPCSKALFQRREKCGQKSRVSVTKVLPGPTKSARKKNRGKNGLCLSTFPGGGKGRGKRAKSFVWVGNTTSIVCFEASLNRLQDVVFKTAFKGKRSSTCAPLRNDGWTLLVLGWPQDVCHHGSCSSR